MQASDERAPGGRLGLGGELTVNRLGFGAMRITGPGVWGEPPDPVEAVAVLRRSLELGVTFIDTAAAYGPEVSERLIAEALAPYPEELVVATKSGFDRPGAGVWRADGRPERIRSDCERSLTLLRLDTIDLFQFHTVDPRVPLEESLGAIVELQGEGKVRLIGVSNVDAEELRRAQAVAPVVSVQNRYSLADRAHEDVLEICEREGIAFIPWFPLAAGDLTRAESLDRIAAAHGASPAQIAIAWLLARSPVMLPIPGTSNRLHLEENMAAASVRLSAEELAELDAGPVS